MQGNQYFEKGLCSLAAYCVVRDGDILAMQSNVRLIALVNDLERYIGKRFTCKNAACMLSYKPERYPKGALLINIVSLYRLSRRLSNNYLKAPEKKN